MYCHIRGIFTLTYFNISLNNKKSIQGDKKRKENGSCNTSIIFKKQNKNMQTKVGRCNEDRLREDPDPLLRSTVQRSTWSVRDSS
jgi:hypothetical protein